MEKYNGWTNYATWRINLEWFDGFNPKDNDYETKNINKLANQLKDYVNEVLDGSSEDNFCKDYAFAFINDVNWYEIAENLIENE